MSFEEGWLCSSGTCVYTRKKELLVVVYLVGVKTFKWLRIYHYKDILKEGEYLFWCVVTRSDNFILLSEFELDIVNESGIYQGAISNRLVSLFDRTKRDKVETFKTQLDELKNVGRVLTF